MFQAWSLPLVLAFSLFVGACSSTNKIDTNSAEGAYELAKKFEKDERYEEAINYYSEVKNKFPYSHLATESELKIADVQFARENFLEAESAYKLFREFHPNHPRIDYVIYRTGLSVMNQLPSTIDRDLKLATTAIEYFDQVLNSFSKSEFAKDSALQKKKAQQMLADKAHYIAEFYFIREKWTSALGRYEDLLKNYSDLGYDVKALYGAAISAYRIKDMDKAKSYFKRLLAEYPKSQELARARKELADGF